MSISLKVFFVILLLSFSTKGHAALEYFVSPSGSDANPGTQSAPFATITKARNTIRTIKSGSGLPAGGITVWLRGGYYNQSATVVFDSRDSGTADKRVIYSGWAGEQVYITGALTLNSSWFSLVTNSSPVWSRLDPAAQGNVYSVNLAAHGISDYGALKSAGFGLTTIAPLELFSGGKTMTLARWPNADQALARTVSSPSSTQVTYSGDRPQRWSQAQDIWMHGLWKTTWADFHLKVTSINNSSKTISFASAPPQGGLGGNQPYYAYNLLEEIDEPREYYVDRTTGILYFWPPGGTLSGSSIQVSTLEDCLMQLNSTQYVSLRNLTFEATRGPLLQIYQGDHNNAVSCLFRNGGEYAVKISGSNNGLDQCEILDCGEDGVLLEGGSRASLVPGNNFVTNCRISRTGRISWAYHPAINFLGGCGNIASHNLIDELHHSAVLFSGNNHVIEYNEIRRVCQLTSDAGAIYSGRDWSYRGNIIRYNFIHHIKSTQEGFGTRGVFLDDCMSAAQVYGNIFYQIEDAAIYCGGGSDNIMTNNIMALCGMAHYNGDYSRNAINNTPGNSFNLLERLAADGIKYQSQPWASAFPACASIPNSWTTVQSGTWRNPKNCVFSNNAGWDNPQWMVESNSSGTGVFSVYASIANNNPAQTILFDEDVSVDRTLRPTQLTASVSGFSPIPFASIGPLLQGQPSAALRPPVPLLEGQTVSASRLDLEWSDNGILSANRQTGFDLERRNKPDGGWQVVRSFGPNVDFYSLTGLAPATSYAFRVSAYNAIGSVYSNVLSLVTQPAPFVPGTATRIEAEKSPITVIADIGANGTVGIAQSGLVSGSCVRLFDAGDATRISFSTASGTYRLAVRVRSGDSTSIGTSFWPNGYQFKVDGSAITLKGDSTTRSALDPSFGISYWGTMYTTSLTLAAGTHSIDVISAQKWALVDYLEVAPVAAPEIKTYSNWQQAHFSTDQIANPVISSWWATPVGDGITNLLKYALDVDPWTAVSGNVVQVSLVSGQPQLSYARPIQPVDLNYTVEVSKDLNVWSTVPQISLGQSNGMETMQATQTGTPYPLIRLRVNCGAWTVVTKPLATGSPTRIEADSPLTILNDVGINGTVGVSISTIDSGGRVRLFDPGDSVRVSFVSGSGSYQIGVRVRAGDLSGPTSFWPGGYSFKLDGTPLALTGDSTTLSSVDPSFGSSYWGTMYSAPLPLTAGVHTIDIISARGWAVADFVNIAPINVAQNLDSQLLMPPSGATIEFINH